MPNAPPPHHPCQGLRGEPGAAGDVDEVNVRDVRQAADVQHDQRAREVLGQQLRGDVREARAAAHLG